MTVDEGSFEEFNEKLIAGNPLDFPDYDEKVESLREKTGEKEAIITGIASIQGQKCVLAVMDPRFMMASMGIAVGEKFTLAAERAIAEKRLLGSALILKYFYPSVAGCEKFTLKLWEKAKKLQGFNDAENWEEFFSEQINVNVLGALGGDSLDDEKSQVRPAPAKSPSSFCGHRFGEKYLPKRMTREMWQEDGIAVKPVQTYYRQFRRLELGYAIEGKQLCMMRLHAHVSREAIEKEFQATKLDLERRFNMTMDSQGHEYGDTLQSSTDGACFEDNRYRIRLWMGTGTKFGIWLEIIDKLLHPSER